MTDATHLDALDTALADYDYSYDLTDQLTQQTYNVDTSDYTYDDFGQLTDAVFSAQDDEDYAYDANGNRTSGTFVGTNNQILSDSTFDYTYDAEGNLVAKTEVTTGEISEYIYDHRNRLTQIERRDAIGAVLSEADYEYDVFDRRIAKTVDADGEGAGTAETTLFVYNGEDVWADFDDSSNVIVRYLFGDRIDENLARYRPGEGTAWYLTDRLGTVRDIIDETGAVVDHIDYDSFGNVILETNSAIGDRFKFTGREFDVETGLYYYRARYYDANLGRFTSQDPIGFDAGDSNLYRYVGNAPTNATDPTGLVTTSEYNTTLENIAIIATASRQGCFLVSVMAGAAGSVITEVALSPVQGPPSPKGYLIDFSGNIVVSAVSCLLFSPAQFTNATFGAVAVTLDLAAVNSISGVAVATLTGSNLFAFAQAGEGGGGDGRITRSPSQTKRLSKGDIKKLEDAGLDAEDLKGGKGTGKLDLFKDKKGNIFVKPKDGSGPGDPLDLNINNF